MAYNVLIVDDSTPMRAVIKKIVKASGFNVGQFFEAINGLEAMEVLNNEWIDLVLTDYNMPDMNGLELVEEMNKDDHLKSIPAVMITTEGSRERIEEFMAKGVMDYIKKPFTPEQIKQKLKQIMGETENEERRFDNGDEKFDF
ncbi:MAG: two-component system, chemotaxis family, chemotaxis protein CheY [Desulfobacteraceae bacterium Eth-SRB2]|nr:MAG: two-component system, chemotaxis family, chemotaxis protein CheY [Desulfobacteraceae bacterium Eth-SRB2]